MRVLGCYPGVLGPGDGFVMRLFRRRQVFLFLFVFDLVRLSFYPITGRIRQFIVDSEPFQSLSPFEKWPEWMNEDLHDAYESTVIRPWVELWLAHMRDFYLLQIQDPEGISPWLENFDIPTIDSISSTI